MIRYNIFYFKKIVIFYCKKVGISFLHLSTQAQLGIKLQHHHPSPPPQAACLSQDIKIGKKYTCGFCDPRALQNSTVVTSFCLQWLKIVQGLKQGAAGGDDGD